MAAKKLVIDLDYNKPQFEFVGDWSGKDLRIVVANLRRAYIRHNKTLRAEATGHKVAEATATQGGVS